MSCVYRAGSKKYLDEIREYYGCSLKEAVSIALYIGFHEMHYDVIHDLTLLLSMNKDSVKEMLTLFDRMYSENPQFFPNIKDYQKPELH